MDNHLYIFTTFLSLIKADYIKIVKTYNAITKKKN